MPLPQPVRRSLGTLRDQAGDLADRARDEAADQAAQLSGRGAGWLDEAGQLVADGAVTITAQLTKAAGAGAARLADRVATTVDHWGNGLGDRIVRLGEEIARLRRHRD